MIIMNQHHAQNLLVCTLNGLSRLQGIVHTHTCTHTQVGHHSTQWLCLNCDFNTQMTSPLTPHIASSIASVVWVDGIGFGFFVSSVWVKLQSSATWVCFKCQQITSSQRGESNVKNYLRSLPSICYCWLHWGGLHESSCHCLYCHCVCVSAFNPSQTCIYKSAGLQSVLISDLDLKWIPI